MSLSSKFTHSHPHGHRGPPSTHKRTCPSQLQPASMVDCVALTQRYLAFLRDRGYLNDENDNSPVNTTPHNNVSAPPPHQLRPAAFHSQQVPPGPKRPYELDCIVTPASSPQPSPASPPKRRKSTGGGSMRHGGWQRTIWCC